MSDCLFLTKPPPVPLQSDPQTLNLSSSLFQSPKFKPSRLVCSSRVSVRPYGALIRPYGALRNDVAMDELDPSSSVELERIDGEDEFDLVLKEAERLKEPLVVLWMANWCRRCIYLKPKLEKLAAEYYPRIRFYCIDVNSVPQRLVNRAGVTKMPTIQLWSDNKMQREINGGYASWMVIEDTRKMIEHEEP